MIKLFDIPDLVESKFLNRPNRFIAEIEYDRQQTTAHIHDPGRLKELLKTGARLLMVPGTGKLPWYVKAVYNENEWVLIDSSMQRKIAHKIFPLMEEFKNAKEIRAEVPLGKSRIDFLIDGKYMESKGVSLVRDGIALFPDAPTIRGARHVSEITEQNGMLLFIIFKKASKFSPNFVMDPNFGEKMKLARKKGIKIICVQVHFDGKSVFFVGKVPLADF